MKRLALLFIALFCLRSSAARTNFDDTWKFSLGDIDGGEKLSFVDKDWRVLNLPHDWSIEGEYNKEHPMADRCGYLPAGIGWYRKTITVPKEWKGKYVEIAFDGIFMNSTVWANGKQLGFRPYGWISFAYDITEQVNESNSITFAVRIDNKLQPSARWYTGSGIYAHTWIDLKDPIHIKNDGIYIRTKGNVISIDTEVASRSSALKNTSVKTSIIDAAGATVQSTTSKLNIDGGQAGKVSQKCSLENPQLWSTASPYLYTAKSEVVVNGEVVDTINTRFGVRDIEWNKKTGLWINGKNVKMRGVCNHQDAGPLGAAVPDKILRFRIQQLKDMGCNAIRTAHNPQTPIFYDICDELGMLVMDEIFDGWKKKASQDYGMHAFDKWWKQDLTDWLKRDRNHPSVIIWSVGNETRGPVAKDIVEQCHLLDPTRPVTSGHSGTEFMDIHGYNGKSEKKKFFPQNKELMIGTENTHTWQVRGYYRSKTWYRDGFPNKRQDPFEIPDLTKNEVFTHDWTDQARNSKQIFNSSYDNATVRTTARHNIEQLRDIPYYAGTFRWTGYDYIGEAGYVHGGWPFKAFMGGAIDLSNFEKDLYYLYQSQWTEKPMVHILPHWTHPKMRLGTKIPVWVYSNCDEVELFFNGKSLGKIKPGKKWDEMQCQWMVPWAAGELKAIGYKKGNVSTEQVVKTADVPSQIALSIDGKSMTDRGNDIVQIRVTTTDAKGEMYPYGENRTYFHVIGDGKIRALGNGSPVDVEKHYGVNSRTAFYGLTRAFIESTAQMGNIALLAGSIIGEKRLITSNKVSIDTQFLSLRGDTPKEIVEIFYTTDGSEPNQTSNRYTQPFDITLGTTVKALVTLNKKPVLAMVERFAEDEGFAWRQQSSSDKIKIGEQAEGAKFKGATTSQKTKGYRGDGYLSFNSAKGFVEWYQENDGDAGKAKVTIRYSSQVKDKKHLTMRLVVNGTSVKDELLFPNTNKGKKGKSKGKDNIWKTVEVTIPIGRGANTIRLETINEQAPFIDEIVVK